ncbi:hypothetical protein SE18_21515 [Herpetosiphon geysericola]|uniref:Uncharacterized protein n=1 Tax=Herpetosiphon geysericola TaxID=70996 RepID=A0A0P6XLQ3_9CHLR|nr:hypothetical protein SE18_21515 [Herpetosiphon geysericola]
MPAIAPILAQGHGTIQFVVDAVEPYQSQLAGQFASSDWPDVVDLIHEGHEAPKPRRTRRSRRLLIPSSVHCILHPSVLCWMLF